MNDKTITLQSQLRIPKAVLSDALAEEAILLELSSGTYFGLNEVGRHIWDGIKAGASLQDIHAQIVRDYEVDPQELEKDMRRFLEELLAKALIEHAA